MFLVEKCLFFHIMNNFKINFNNYGDFLKNIIIFAA